MELFNIENSKEFFNVVNECTGKVELVRKDGTHLNLNSKLTQNILSIEEKFDDLKLAVHDHADVMRLLSYAMGTKYVA